MRKRLKQWHILLSISVGAVLLLQSISGALLTFGKEIQRSISPANWTVSAEHNKADVGYLLEQLQLQADRNNVKVSRLYLETQPHLAWRALMSNGEQWNINPYTGKIIDRFRSGDDFYSVVLQIHRWLLVSDEPARRWARHVTSVTASALIIQVFIGLFLWLKPAKSAMKRLRFKRHKTAKARLTQWHLMLGVYTAPLIILVAVCGIGFNWPWVGKLAEWSTASVIERPAKHRFAAVGGAQAWSEAIRNGQQALPQGQLYRIYFPQQENQALSLRYKMPGESYPYSFVWLDGGSGDVIDVYDASLATSATQLWNFKYVFHIGNFAGLAVRMMWLLLSLLPSFFLLSGIWVWWAKKNSSRH